jgi:hypothetical protein
MANKRPPMAVDRPLMELRPSPEDLVGMLVEEELVALDLLLDRLPIGDKDERDMRDPADFDDPQLRLLVPDPVRRGTVVTVARQLRQIGVSIRPRRKS